MQERKGIEQRAALAAAPHTNDVHAWRAMLSKKLPMYQPRRLTNNAGIKGLFHELPTRHP
jgi:hypothetical protein